MYCQKCGKQIAAGSTFCNFCGAAQGGGISSNAPWETCEINFRVGDKATRFHTGWFYVTFHAVALGPKGRYTAAQSEKCTDKICGGMVGAEGPCGYYGDKAQRETGDCQDAHGDLVAKLTKEGWEPTGRGALWFNHRFRRRAR